MATCIVSFLIRVRPTVLTKKVAQELGLTITGENIGTAHGMPVKMELAKVEQLIIGDVEFRNILVFIYDASNQVTANCVLDGGIIGSELMSLSNWQINFADKELILTSNIDQLKFINNAEMAKLKVENYPYYPMLAFEINGELTDIAMFDTGNAELLHLSNATFAKLNVSEPSGIDTIKAFGTFGESAAGRGQDEDSYLVPLKNLSIGEQYFSDIKVWTKQDALNLIGAKVFESHIVTLDYDNERVYFHQYQEQKNQKESYGLKLYLKGQSVHVALLWDLFPAKDAGLKLHDKIIKINETDLSQIESTEVCSILDFINSIEQMERMEITFVRNGVTKQVVLEQ